MSRTLIAHGFHLARDPAERALGKPYPPLGPLISAAEAEAAGHDVAVYDATFAQGPEAFADALDGHRPARVALVADPHAVPAKMCTETHRADVLHMLRLARERGAAVFVAGPDVSDHPELYADADVVCVGEHDAALRQWVSGTALQGRLPRTSREDLDAVPLPAWHRVDMAEYARRWRARHGLWEANVAASRGCPWRCNWCAKPTWGRSYRARPAEGVADEVRALRERHGVDQVWFTDDVFALKPGWLGRYADAMRGAEVPYRCLTRADLLQDPGFAADLARSGCVEVWIGAESGSDRVLTAMDKDGTVAEIERAAANLRAHGIRRGVFLQLGYPGESHDDVLATVRTVRRLRPEAIGISVSYPLPGTVFHERVAAQLGRTNWRSSMANEVLYDAPYPQAYYDAARELLRAEHAVLTFTLAPTLTRAGLRRAAGLVKHAVTWPAARGRMELAARRAAGGR